MIGRRGPVRPVDAAREPAVDDAAAAVRSLELHVARRLTGILQGDHLGLLPGPGSEPGDGRAYVPGDEVRHIDWSLTARSGSVQVRDRVADRELETWLVVDRSASLDFGTAEREKRDVAAGVVAAFGFLASGGGNRVGAVVADADGGGAVHPPRGGRDHIRSLVLAVQGAPRAGHGRVDLAAALHRVARLARRRGLVVVVSDLLDQPDLLVPLRALTTRHDVVVVEVRDRREDALPAVGLVTLVDPETGRTLEVQTDDPTVRERFARAAADRREQIATAVRAAGAHHLVLTTDGDWLAAVADHVARRRRARR